jgi:hypothetical protein
MKYEQAGQAIGKEVDIKNTAYGDSVGRSGDILRILYPNGVQPEQYGDMQLVTRIIDKLFRIATDKHALGESPYRDISGYGILGMVRDEERPIGQQAEMYLHPSQDEAKEFSVGRLQPDGYHYLPPGEMIQAGDQGQALGSWFLLTEYAEAIGETYDPKIHSAIRRKLC